MESDNAEDESIDEIFEDFAQFQDDDYINFDKFLEHYRGELSKNTLVAYGRALKFIDFNPLDKSPEPSCLEEEEQERFDLSQFQSLWATRKMKEVCGRGADNRATRNRQAYLCWLALKKYLKAVGEARKIDQLPDSDDFDDRKSRNGGSEESKVKLSEHQVQKLMDEADDRMECALILLYYGGMRSYELLNLKPSWFDFSLEDRIEVKIPARYAKGKRGNRNPEKLYVKEDFQEQLQFYILEVHGAEDQTYKEFLKELEESEEKHLFAFKEDSMKTFKDLRVERWRLWESLRNLAEDIGLNKADKLSSHDFRGSQIQRVYETVKDLKKTRRVARHKSSETTEEHYLKRGEEEKLETYKEAFED